MAQLYWHNFFLLLSLSKFWSNSKKKKIQNKEYPYGTRYHPNRNGDVPESVKKFGEYGRKWKQGIAHNINGQVQSVSSSNYQHAGRTQINSNQNPTKACHDNGASVAV